MNVGSLFSGIGGFDLGLERAGMRVVWQCESDLYCRRVLARHWPGVPCYPDVRALVADTDGDDEPQEPEGADGEQGQRASKRRRELVTAGVGAGSRNGDGTYPSGDGGTSTGGSAARDAGVPMSVPYVDVLAGGFPCQDLSYAGKGAGIDGSRSGLWREFARLIGELRPRYVIVENVPALASRGLDRVLADLAACGFDAEWDHLPASAFGAPHRRDRLWLVAYPGSSRRRQDAGSAHGDEGADAWRGAQVDHEPIGVGAKQIRTGGRDASVADANQERRRGWAGKLGPAGWAESSDGGQWLTEPDVGRVANGVPARVDRLRSLGNALVPQIAEWIGRRIVSWES